MKPRNSARQRYRLKTYDAGKEFLKLLFKTEDEELRGLYKILGNRNFMSDLAMMIYHIGKMIDKTEMRQSK